MPNICVKFELNCLETYLVPIYLMHSELTKTLLNKYFKERNIFEIY
jgi:hypothetical protein